MNIESKLGCCKIGYIKDSCGNIELYLHYLCCDAAVKYSLANEIAQYQF